LFRLIFINLQNVGVISDASCMKCAVYSNMKCAVHRNLTSLYQCNPALPEQWSLRNGCGCGLCF